MMSNDLLMRLRAAMEGAEDWYAIERAFTDLVADDEVDEARAAAYAFGYMLVSSRNEDSRARHGVFAPRIEWEGGGAFPPPLPDVEEVTRDEWGELYEELDHDRARSRLGDLLWVTRHGLQPHVAGRAAAESYVSLVADQTWSLMDRVDSATRALEIASELNDSALRDQATEAAVSFARAELDQSAEWRPGVVLRVLGPLVDAPPAARRPELRELLARAKERYEADPFIAEAVSELQLRLSAPFERDALRAGQVERWRRAASEATGITRLAHLRHALELARATGQPNLARALALEIEGIDEQELDLKRQEASVSVPVEHLDKLVAGFGDHASALEALARFGIEGPPTGRAQEIDRTVADLAQRFPLQRLITRQVLGEYNALVFEASTPETHERIDRAQHESRGIQLFAPVAVRILDEIHTRYERPTRTELAEWFTTDLVDRTTADRLAEGIERHWGGDHHAAALLLATQVENALRAIAARLGIPVTKPPRGERPGGVIGIGSILAGLEARLDESWRRYLVNLLADPVGVNLRNRLAHGLLAYAGAGDSAALVHAACFLRSLTGSVERPPEVDEI